MPSIITFIIMSSSIYVKLILNIGGISLFYMYINLELFRIFYMTAKTGSISKAAKALFTSQPAVSQSIKVLENKLGGRLFHRTPKGVTLTAEGEIFFKYIEQGYSFMEKAEQTFYEMKNLMSGQIKIGVSDTLCKHYLLPYLNDYHEAFPDIRVHVTNQTSYEIIDLLKSGKVDLGVVNLPIDSEQSLQIIETLKIQDCFVVGCKYKHIHEAPVSIRDLGKYPVLLLEKDSNSRRFIDHYLQKNGAVIIPEFELGTIDLLIEFAKIGFGIACVVKNFIEEELKKKHLYEVIIKEKIPQRAIGVVTLREVPLSAAAEKFIEYLTC